MNVAHNLDAEQSVLGAVLLSDAVLTGLVDEGLEPSDFYREAHAEIFGAMLELAAGGEPVDQLTLLARLESSGRLAAVGGRAAIDLLAGSVPAVGNVRRYARIVRETARDRRINSLAAELAASVNGTRPALRRQLTAALAARDALDRPAEGPLRILRASDVAVEEVEFLIDQRVPVGALTLLAGDPGLGKSTWTCDAAASVTTGRHGRAGTVLMANAEDSPSTVIVPRLVAAGADLERVEFFSIPDRGDADRPFTLPGDVPLLEEHVAKANARMVVLDPLAAFLDDGTNTKSDHSVRRALAPLATMASRLKVAVIVVAHLNKSPGADAIYRVGGSIGLVGGARSLLLFTRDPDDPEGEDGHRRALGHAKSNWGRLAPTLLYEHTASTVTVRGVTVDTHRLVDAGTSEVAGNGLLGVDPEDTPATQRDRAGELIADMLGAVSEARAKDLETAARRQGISQRTLDRAARELGVEREKRGFPAVSWWSLPTSVASAGGETVPPPLWRDSENLSVEPNHHASPESLAITPSDGDADDLDSSLAAAATHEPALETPETA